MLSFRLRLRSFRFASISIAVGGGEDSVGETSSSSPPKTFPKNPVKARQRIDKGQAGIL